MALGQDSSAGQQMTVAHNLGLLMWHQEFDLSEEDASRLRGRPLEYLRRLWPFFAPYSDRIVRGLLLLLLSSGLGLLGPLLLKRAIDVNIAAGERGLAGLALTSLLYLVVQSTAIAAGYLQNFWLAQAGELGAADLKFRLLRHLLNMPVAFFDRMPVGRLISRVESDTEALKMLFARTTVMLIQAVLMILGMSLVMAVTNWRLYLLVLVLMPPFALAFWIFQRRVRPVYLAVRRTVAETNSLVAESLKCLPVIGAFCQEQRFARRMDELNRQKFRQEIRAFRMWNAVWFLVDFGDVVCTGLVVAVGGLLALQGRLTIGTLFLFVSYIARLFGPLRMISDQMNVLQRGLASAERSFELLDQAVEPGGVESGGRLGLKEQVSFENVSFSYDGSHLVLHDINLVVRGGEKVALVGETGGGKTSLVSLLLKFYPCQQGTIRFGAQAVSDIDRGRLRRSIGFVPQEVTVFPGTILDNLRMFDESISREQVIEAAKRARVHQAVMRFEKGYDTVLAEAGANFSLGERQLLSFARAMVREPELLILDEATSSVDPYTEELIQEGLVELLQGRTAIIVAHRLATIRMADRVVVVHHGRIAEQGTHEELLARNGIYARLYRLQYVSGAGG